jgi:hypothetical protein
MRWAGGIIDRYPLKTTYVVASALQVLAMLGLAMGNGYVALAGAIFSALLSAAAGPVENILIARYTPSRYHGLGFGAKFGSRSRQPARHPADRLGAQGDRQSRPAVPRLAGTSVLITAVALLLPRERGEGAPRAVPQPAPAE